jgi:hypothetical protein
MLRSLLVFLAFVPASLYPATGLGDVITQTRSTGGPIATDWTQSLVFDQFDPRLGTPLGVTLGLEATIDQTYTMIFTVASPTTITLTSTGNRVAVDSLLTVAGPDHLVAHTQDTIGPFTPPATDAHLSGSVAVADPTPFLGTGTVTLPVVATSFSSFASDSGNGGGTVRTTAAADVTLSYTYTPPAVPEPATWILPGLAVTGLAARGAIRRRSR